MLSCSLQNNVLVPASLTPAATQQRLRAAVDYDMYWQLSILNGSTWIICSLRLPPAVTEQLEKLQELRMEGRAYRRGMKRGRRAQEDYQRAQMLSWAFKRPLTHVQAPHPKPS